MSDLTHLARVGAEVMRKKGAPINPNFLDKLSDEIERLEKELGKYKPCVDQEKLGAGSRENSQYEGQLR